jgi:hypothetical protein
MLIRLNTLPSIQLLEAVAAHLIDYHLINRYAVFSNANARTSNIIDKFVE